MVFPPDHGPSGPHTGMSPALMFSSQKKKGPKSSRLLMGKRINGRDSDPPRPSPACISTDLCSPSTFLAQADEHVVARNPHAGGHWVCPTLPPLPTTCLRRRAPLPTYSSQPFRQPPQGLITSAHRIPHQGAPHCLSLLQDLASPQHPRAASNCLGVSPHPCHLPFLRPHTCLSSHVFRSSSQETTAP